MGYFNFRPEITYRFSKIDKSISHGMTLWNSIRRFGKKRGSTIVNLTGKIVFGPLVDKKVIIIADVDPFKAIEEEQNLDKSRHYSQFDILNKPLT